MNEEKSAIRDSTKSGQVNVSDSIALIFPYYPVTIDCWVRLTRFISSDLSLLLSGKIVYVDIRDHQDIIGSTLLLPHYSLTIDCRIKRYSPGDDLSFHCGYPYKLSCHHK